MPEPESQPPVVSLEEAIQTGQAILTAYRNLSLEASEVLAAIYAHTSKLTSADIHTASGDSSVSHASLIVVQLMNTFGFGIDTLTYVTEPSQASQA